MATETRVPTTVITFTQPFSTSHHGVTENYEAVHAKIATQVTSLAFEAIKLWEDTRTVHMGGLTAQVHDHGYERVAEIISTTITDQRTKKSGGKWGKPRQWDWSGSGTCVVKVNSFSEDAPK